MPDQVSVVLPTHNSELYIEEAVESILGQTHRNLEVVVTDDGSTDNTPRLLEQMAQQDTRINLTRLQGNLGAAVARNTSITNARGRYLAFCDADDRWVANKVEAQLRFMSHSGAGLSFTAYQIINSDGSETGRFVDLKCSPEVSYEDALRKRATLGCSTIMIDRTRIPLVKMPNLRTGQDYATWLAILRQGHTAFGLREALTHYRITPGSLSRNKMRKARRQWQIYRVVERLSLAKSSICFASYAYHAIFRP